MLLNHMAAMAAVSDPWDLLNKIPERGWIVLRTARWLSLIQLENFGLVAVDIAAPGIYQVRLTAAGRLYRDRMTDA